MSGEPSLSGAKSAKRLWGCRNSWHPVNEAPFVGLGQNKLHAFSLMLWTDGSMHAPQS
eukprot:CAMPEP_0179061452 /NCGR_PEP_ID=MMETSP0796-20121207/26405_1 /TAXON_ID=73915 /ORGANISM="Pyrodinium bahamense, Strain pbaha01" /LENGTH=57 /DNA_ID=CAMNT_0020758299 /DNA_START=42 /DNA_END=211 /DNA_ORIENTATION=-